MQGCDQNALELRDAASDHIQPFGKRDDHDDLYHLARLYAEIQRTDPETDPSGVDPCRAPEHKDGKKSQYADGHHDAPENRQMGNVEHGDEEICRNAENDRDDLYGQGRDVRAGYHEKSVYRRQYREKEQRPVYADEIVSDRPEESQNALKHRAAGMTSAAHMQKGKKAASFLYGVPVSVFRESLCIIGRP